jgi:F420-non-reducing hydrogenase iron-sulfur subunit
LLKAVIGTLGLEPERIQLSWVSASEGKRFSEVVNQFDQLIRGLGPNPLKNRPSV